MFSLPHSLWKCPRLFQHSLSVKFSLFHGFGYYCLNSRLWFWAYFEDLLAQESLAMKPLPHFSINSAKLDHGLRFFFNVQCFFSIADTIPIYWGQGTSWLQVFRKSCTIIGVLAQIPFEIVLRESEVISNQIWFVLLVEMKTVALLIGCNSFSVKINDLCPRREMHSGKVYTFTMHSLENV